MRINNPLKLTAYSLLLTGLLVLTGVLLMPATARADTSWPDSNSNSIPDWVEQQLQNACSRQGAHTFHLTWVDPWSLTPNHGDRTDTTYMRSVAFICAGVSYAYSDDITHTITSLPNGMSLPSGSVLRMGRAERGGFSSVAQITLNIDLTRVSGCGDRAFQYDGFAYPGGVYDDFRNANGTFHLCVSVPSNPLPRCSTTTPSVGTGTAVSFTASGGNGRYVWTAPGSSAPGPVNGSSHTVTYTSTGLKTVTVTSGGQSSNCSVTVTELFSCRVLTSRVAVGENAQFQSSILSITTTWSAPGSTRTSGSTNFLSPTFTTTYTTPGTKSVVATSLSGQRSTCTVEIVAYPYLTVYGGDVQSGCGADAGNIYAFNRDNSANGFAGALSRMGVFAKGDISQFASAGGGASPKRTTFSNTDSARKYGGDAGTDFCSVNYWDKISDTALPGWRNSPAGTRINSGHLAFRVNGDVMIKGNIYYGNAGSWSVLSDIPSFHIVVKGNIYISGDVTQLDGVYVAMKKDDGTGGIIYTCADVSGAIPRVYSATQLAGATCNNKLTVNGSFVADRVRFLRTGGSVGLAQPNEAPTAPSIAEVFMYGPELWVR